MNSAKSEDEIENKLYDKYVDAEYDYLEHLRNKLVPKFCEETREYVLDQTHWAYECYFGSSQVVDMKCKLNKEEQQELKMLFRKLSIICHPDKCNQDWSDEIFKLLNESHKNFNIDVIRKLDSHWTEHKSFDKFKLNESNDEVSKINIINQWKSELWYNWFYGSETLKEIFIPQEKLKDKLMAQNEKLRNDNESLKAKLEELNK